MSRPLPRSLFRIDRTARYGEAIRIQTEDTHQAKAEERSNRRSIGGAAGAQTGTVDRFADRTPAIQGYRYPKTS